MAVRGAYLFEDSDQAVGQKQRPEKQIEQRGTGQIA